MQGRNRGLMGFVGRRYTVEGFQVASFHGSKQSSGSTIHFQRNTVNQELTKEEQTYRQT